MVGVTLPEAEQESKNALDSFREFVSTSYSLLLNACSTE